MDVRYHDLFIFLCTSLKNLHLLYIVFKNQIKQYLVPLFKIIAVRDNSVTAIF